MNPWYETEHHHIVSLNGGTLFFVAINKHTKAIESPEYSDPIACKHFIEMRMKEELDKQVEANFTSQT